MFTRAHNRSLIVTIGFSVLWLLSCTPNPEYKFAPEFEWIYSEPKLNKCLLSAAVPKKVGDQCEVGFYYGYTGVSKENMTKVKCVPEDGYFCLYLESLMWETEYVYMAYVSNGYNEVCSDKERFSIDRRPFLYLAEKETTVSWHQKEFHVEVLTNVAYDILKLGEADWIDWYHKEGECYMSVKENLSSETRICTFLFKSGYHDYQTTFEVRQEGYKEDVPVSKMILPYHDKSIGAGGETFIMEVEGDSDFKVFMPLSVEWISYYRNARQCFFTVERNQYPYPRRCSVVFVDLVTTQCDTLHVRQDYLEE